LTEKPTVTDRRLFLFEIGTEELPPRALRSLANAFRAGMEEGLQGLSLEHGEITVFATPRRLAVSIADLEASQADRPIERRGPPVNVAIGEDGAPGRAALKFAESCGVAFDQLGRLATPKGEYLAYSGVEQGKPAEEILPGVLQAALDGLPIPRRMRWGDEDFEFVRPVHWLVALLDDRVVPMELFGVAADRLTRGHRFHSPGTLLLDHANGYVDALEGQGFVIPALASRRDTVRDQVLKLAGDVGGQPVYDDELLDEVTALVEWPVPVAGEFDARFLELPREVLVSTLQAHQRYFPVEDESGSLLPRFIAVTNLESRDPEEVRRGNERVVRPRLSDAGFFWDSDRRRTLESRIGDLADVVFQKKLGSLADKSRRVEQLAARIAENLGVDSRHAARAAALAKCDLLTAMVGEFPDLQGVMGRYYALGDGEPGEVADAIREQYLPRFAGDRLPLTDAGKVVSLAEKLDTLTGIFAIGQRPSGTRDPFGLRRAALGALRILIEGQLELDMQALLSCAASLQPGEFDVDAVAGEVYEYMMDRLRTYYQDGVGDTKAPVDVFEAVYARSPVSVLDFHRRLCAVLEFTALPAAASLAAANKRVANILRQAGLEESLQPDPDLMAEKEEQALNAALQALRADVEPLLQQRDYRAAMERLASLREPVDAFFDEVMVMAEDPAQKANRLALLSQMRELFLHTADLSRLQG
jgi:glycyl-tRNA synthetase beta chain